MLFGIWFIGAMALFFIGLLVFAWGFSSDNKQAPNIASSIMDVLGCIIAISLLGVTIATIVLSLIN